MPLFLVERISKEPGHVDEAGLHGDERVDDGGIKMGAPVFEDHPAWFLDSDL